MNNSLPPPSLPSFPSLWVFLASSILLVLALLVQGTPFWYLTTVLLALGLVLRLRSYIKLGWYYWLKHKQLVSTPKT